MLLTEKQFNIALFVWIGIAVVTFGVLLFVTAPYGRHSKVTWGPMISNRIGWVVMEFFVLVVLYVFILTGSVTLKVSAWIMVGLFTIHYINRSLIFPLRLNTKGKKMPVVIMLMGMGFNLVNGFFVGYHFGNIKEYETEWLYSPQFIIGLLLFLFGMFLNIWSDTILINLRKPGETNGYKIPTKGPFKLVSCPNLLGEVLEWGGFALFTFCFAGLSFFIWTFANLVPRAMSHHKWYQHTFEDYPTNRRAIFPFIV